MTVLAFGSFGGGALRPVSREVAAAGRLAASELGVPLIGVLLGCSPGGSEAAAFARCGLDRVVVAADPHLAVDVDECFVAAAAALVTDLRPSLILFSHSIDNGQRATRLGARLGAGLVTDCVGIDVRGGETVLRKPMYGGLAVAELAVATRPAIATLRPHTFGRAETMATSAPVETIVTPRVACRVSITVDASASVEAPLDQASVVVSGGRGVGGPSHWHYVEEAASALGGVVAGSRVATDAGWVPSSRQIGLTGTGVAPDLYLALGISGAPEHMAGITNARAIVAVNTDPDATIFRYARYGVVGDLRDVVPALVRRLGELRAAR